ncbi:MAG: PqqD family peptide modification chaperone [Alphaproteobacteria bacterium]|nr:PqqD family peptide modification chaperone [Alphaproteobacteria bacterium]
MTPDASLNGEGHLSIVGDDGLVFVPRTQLLYALNTSATFIWCCLEEGRSAAETIAALQATFGIGAAQAREFLEDALALWRGWGVLAGSAPQQAAADSAPSPALPAQGAPLPADAPARLRLEDRYRLLDGTAVLRFEDDASRARIHPILAHLHREADDAPPAVTIAILRDGADYAVYRDGRRYGGAFPLDRLGPLVKGHVWQACLAATRHLLNIHAGAVADSGGCILLPGQPGSSKSTLSAALGRSGFTFLSDEVALLTQPELRVRPVPLSFCVKSTGWDVLAPLYPELATRDVHNRGDGKVVRYVPPPVEAATLRADYDVTRVVFPRYVPGGATALRPVAPVEGLRRLLSECVSTPEGLSVPMIETLVAWVERVRFWELDQSDLGAAIEAIRATRDAA